MEVLVAVVLLVIVFFGLAQMYWRGRVQMDYEETRRKATAAAQARLDGIRRDYGYDDLPALAARDTTYTVDNRTFAVAHEVMPGVPEAQATTLTITVTWTEQVAGNDVDRTLTCTTILGRGMPWPH
jgi:Tfp pilus assembly protein PilV